ncbi:copper amine oxidase N-terminal domain-containing protein [Gorillibacterium massiliense]|uniref:copper amine oxidase N-terminal domain-containing protein n=1 Tax=Gorillibacterium massiliense TaxID=1280390 RepID=UPI0004B0BFF5|nr:copper amine oxidase N-terminal domain-containing protein [Gorillibacterium massiliense]
MKKIATLCLVLVISLLLNLTASAAAKDPQYEPVKVKIDGVLLNAEAYSVKGRTMVPLRAIFERLGAEIKWNAEAQMVTAVKGQTTIKLVIGKATATINNKSVTLDVPPMLIKERTFVPLRFVSEALGGEVSYDAPNKMALVNTKPAECKSGVVHSGKINSAGETWKACESPHFVEGDFDISGLESPVLTIEAGAVVRFMNGASLFVGEVDPGGLVINGTADKPVELTADSASPEPGFWKGIRFGESTLRNKAAISHANIEYAGEGDKGAVNIQSYGQPLEVNLADTQLKNNLFSGIQLAGFGRLASESPGIIVTGTHSSLNGGGFPVIADIVSSHQLPKGKYTGNALDAIRITNISSYAEMKSNTTWRNLGIPYDMDISIDVDGAANPVLTIEPGVVTNWAPDTGLYIAETNKGGLHAVGTADKPITFTSSMEQPGSWQGITFSSNSASKTIQLEYAVVEYAKKGAYLYNDLGPVIKNSTFRNNEEYGLYMPLYKVGVTDYRVGLGNTFKENGTDQNFEMTE